MATIAMKNKSGVLDRADRLATITKVQYLERAAFDTDGHIRRRISRAQAESLVAQLNDLRSTLGWLEIDLDGHWRWPN